MLGDFGGHAAENELRQAGKAPCTTDDKVGMFSFDHFHDFLDRVPIQKMG